MYWFWLWSQFKLYRECPPVYVLNKLSDLSESLTESQREVLFELVFDM